MTPAAHASSPALSWAAEGGSSSVVSPVQTLASGAVWLTAQQPPLMQRRGRYVGESAAHPAKMLPAVAAHAIATYTAPGEVVLDPMCGIGTTVVEAVHAGRVGIGVEYEARWAAVAQANLDLAVPGDTGGGGAVGGVGRGVGQVMCGDARQLDGLLPEQLRGRVGLVVTSPPYGPTVHGRLANKHGEPIVKVDHRYGDLLDRGNLANIGHHRLLGAFTRILTEAAGFLRPGGHVVITVRPWREHAELIDLPSQITDCGTAAGLVLVDRCVALLGRVTDTGAFVARGSFFQRAFVARQRAAGLPLHLITHEDVLAFTMRPPAPYRPSTSRVSRQNPAKR